MFIFAILPEQLVSPSDGIVIMHYDFLMMNSYPPESLAAMTKPTSSSQNLPALALWLVVISHSGIDLLHFYLFFFFLMNFIE